MIIHDICLSVCLSVCYFRWGRICAARISVGTNTEKRAPPPPPPPPPPQRPAMGLYILLHSYYIQQIYVTTKSICMDTS